jgi:hypothetical protein
MSPWQRFCKKLAWAGYACSMAVCLSAMLRPEHGIWVGFYVLQLVLFVPFGTAIHAVRKMNKGRRFIGDALWRKLILVLPTSLKRLFTGTALFAAIVIGHDIYQDLILKSRKSGFQGPSSMPLEWKTWITPVSPDDFVSYGAVWAVFFLISGCLLTMRENWSGPRSKRKRG